MKQAKMKKMQMMQFKSNNTISTNARKSKSQKRTRMDSKMKAMFNKALRL